MTPPLSLSLSVASRYNAAVFLIRATLLFAFGFDAAVRVTRSLSRLA